MLKEKVELIARLRATMKETAHPEWPGNITINETDDSWKMTVDCITKRSELTVSLFLEALAM